VEEIPVADLCTGLRRVATLLQGMQVSNPRLRLYHDWWQHDGLHFEKGPMTFHDLFAMIETPRAAFEATPGDHDVFVGIAPEDGHWYLRFRAEWDADDRNIVGDFAVTVPVESAAAFRTGFAATPLKDALVEEMSAGYYKKVMV